MKKKIIIVGPGTPPIIGPSIATKIIISSRLSREFDLIHFDSNVHRSLDSLGTFKLSSIVLNIQLYIKFIYRIIRCNPDLILVPVSQTNLGFLKDSIYLILGYIVGKKTVIQLRGSNWRNWQKRSNALVRSYTKLVVSVTKGAIVQGECLRYLFEDLFSSNRIFVVPNGINKKYKEKEFTNKENLNILYLGNLQPSKGILDVINGLKILSKKHCNLKFQLDVIGNWRDNKTYIDAKKVIDDNKLNIFFHGQKTGSKKEEFLTNADVLVFTPKEPEGLPWVIIEAIAARLPVIATSQGAIKEAVLDNKNGFLVSSNYPDEIAEKIKLLFDVNTRRSMSEKSFIIYKTYFTEDVMVNKYKECFEYIISR